MAAQVIIDGVIYGAPVYGSPNPNENIGGFIIVMFDGVECLVEKKDVPYLDIGKHQIRDISVVPEFLHLQKLVVDVGPTRTKSVDLYPLRKEDIAPLGKALSERYSVSWYNTHARNLVTWSHGKIVRQNKLSVYYNDVSPEEDEFFSL